MNAELYRRARDVFVAAIEVGDAERDAFVERACADHAELRAEVASLLAAHFEQRGFDSVSAAPELESVPPIETVSFPAQIGRYRILELLGEGGMGAVYLAEQDSPRRKVALKVLRPGIVSPSRTRRFEREAEILGHLHHTGIAQVFESGIADGAGGSQRYLAMELVDGRSLVEHADAHGLDVRARIGMLVRVCHAIQHAHERGVVHRDLKPANILVDEQGTPKVLDFGIAHATAEDLRARTLITGAGEVLGTLPYMSPEQLDGTAGEADARADVYALGVIGYELSSGRLPIELGGKNLAEAARAIREDEPPLLGARVRALRGDVETIFAKALEKERDRRYPSALALAQDLERWLGEQPIEARPPSTMYQLAKFARRNRVLVGGVAAVLVTLMLGIAGTAWQALHATQQRNDAVEAQSLAQREAKRAQAALHYLQGMFETVDPNVVGRNAKMIDAVDEVARDLDRAFPDDPLTEASLQRVLGAAYEHLGTADLGERHLRRAADLLRTTLGPADAETEAAECELARCLWANDKNAEAEAIVKRILDRSSHDPSVDPLRSVRASIVLAKVLKGQKQFDEASAILENALEVRRRLLGETRSETVDSYADLANLRYAQGKYAEAIDLYREGLRIQEGLARPKIGVTLAMTNNLAATLRVEGQRDQARALLEKMVEKVRNQYGEDDPRVLTTRAGLGQLLHDLGLLNEASRIQEDVLSRARRVLGDTHSVTLGTLSNLAALRRRQGRLDEAVAAQYEFVEALSKKEGQDSWPTLEARCDLAVYLQDLRQLGEAEEIFRDVATRSRSATFPSTWQHVWLEKARYGGFLLGQPERYAEAEQLLLESYSSFESLLGAADWHARDTATCLAALYTHWKKPVEAARWNEKLAPAR